jgi:hypothetical protein
MFHRFADTTEIDMEQWDIEIVRSSWQHDCNN